MYTAKILDKKIQQGKLIVEIQYSAPELPIYTEIFETTQNQQGMWLGDIVKRRLIDLNSLPKLLETIEVGSIIDASIKHDEEKETFRKNNSDYNRYMDIARTGIISHDREVIVNLRKWLRDNFKDEYIDLF